MNTNKLKSCGFDRNCIEAEDADSRAVLIDKD